MYANCQNTAKSAGTGLTAHAQAVPGQAGPSGVRGLFPGGAGALDSGARVPGQGAWAAKALATDGRF